jgi:hypothetical protein
VFDSDKNLLNASDSVRGLKHLGGCLIVEQRQWRGQPMSGLMLVTENGYRVRNHRNQSRKISGFRRTDCQVRHVIPF